MIAGDDANAKAVVTTLLDEFGFDTVGPLMEGWRTVPRRTTEELRKDLAVAERYATDNLLDTPNCDRPDSTKSP